MPLIWWINITFDHVNKVIDRKIKINEIREQKATEIFQTILDNKIEEIDKTYLQYAPNDFKEIWHESTPNEKIRYKANVEFTPDWPNIIGASGKKYKLEKNNLSVNDDLLEEWKIDKYKGKIYFEKFGLQKYINQHKISIPSTEHYTDMLKNMPAQDYWNFYIVSFRRRSILNWRKCIYQLISILGQKNNIYLYESEPWEYYNGYILSNPWWLFEETDMLFLAWDEGYMKDYMSWCQYPTLAFRSKK